MPHLPAGLDKRTSLELGRNLEIIGETHDLSDWDVTSYRGGLIGAVVPIAQLQVDPDAAVNQLLIETYAEDMREIAEQRGGSGQLEAILVGHVTEQPPYLGVANGLHRHGALLLNAAAGHTLSNFASTTIIPDIGLDAFLDRCISATGGHDDLGMSRIHTWANSQWSRTEWAGLMSVLDAFRLYTFKTVERDSTHDQAVIAEIKRWVGAKAARWELSPRVILDHLKTASEFDDPIMPHIRSDGRGFTPAIARRAITAFTHEQGVYDDVLVTIVAKVANRWGITDSQADSLFRTAFDAVTWEDAEIACAAWRPPTGKEKKAGIKPVGPSPESIAFAALERLATHLTALELLALAERENTGWNAKRIDDARKVARTLGAIVAVIDPQEGDSQASSPVNGTANGNGHTTLSTIEPPEIIAELTEEETTSHRAASLQSFMDGDLTPLELSVALQLGGRRATIRQVRRFISDNSSKTLSDELTEKLHALNVWATQQMASR